jgi:hypothetical protein
MESGQPKIRSNTMPASRMCDDSETGPGIIDHGDRCKTLPEREPQK